MQWTEPLYDDDVGRFSLQELYDMHYECEYIKRTPDGKVYSIVGEVIEEVLL